MESLYGLHNALLLSRCGKGKAVDENITLWDTHCNRSVHYLLRNGKALLRLGRDTVLVKGKSYNGGAVLLYDGKYAFK